MRRIVVAAALAALQLACSSAKGPATGSLTLRAGAITSEASVTRLTAELQPAGTTVDLSPDGAGGWTATLEVPAGTQTVTLRAWTGTTLVAEGSAVVTVVAGHTASAVVTLLDTSGPPPALDHGPILRTVTSTATTLAPGEHAILTADAFDPDGDPITYQWSRSCASGAFSAPNAAQTEFWSDVAATCTVTLEAASGALSTSGSLPIAIQGAGTGQIVVSATFEPQPYVDAVQVVGATPPAPYVDYWISRTATSYCADCFVTANGTLPGSYHAYQPLTLEARFANLPVDPVAGSVAYWMDDDCGGSSTSDGVLTASGAAFAETFTWTPPAAERLCMITIHLQHAGMQDSLTLAALVTLPASPPPADPTCADDTYEPNDDAATATVLPTILPPPWSIYLPPGPSFSLPYPSLVGNDADWFTVEMVPPFEQFRVVTGSEAWTPVLALYAADGATLIAQAQGPLQATLTPGVRYLLKVEGGAMPGSTCGTLYDLEFWADDPTPPLEY